MIGDRATNNVGEIQAITRCVQQAIDQVLDIIRYEIGKSAFIMSLQILS